MHNNMCLVWSGRIMLWQEVMLWEEAEEAGHARETLITEVQQATLRLTVSCTR
jgi:hypothetical protein